MARTKTKVKVGNLKQTEKEVKNPSRQSAWFLTINTNKRYEDDSEDLEKAGNIVAESLDSYFSNKEELLKGLTWRAKLHDYDDALSEFSLERSPNTHALHAHGVLCIIHHTNLRIASAKIQAALTKEMNNRGLGTKGCYVHWKLLDDWDSKAWNKERIYEYIDKNKEFDPKKPSAKSTKKKKDAEEKEKKRKISKLTKSIDEDTNIIDDSEPDDESSDKSDPETEEDEPEEEEPQPKPRKTKKHKPQEEQESEAEEAETEKPVPKRKAKPKRKIVEDSEEEEVKPEPKKAKKGVSFSVLPLPKYKKNLDE
jgi:hypothetical protein